MRLVFISSVIAISALRMISAVIGLYPTRDVVVMGSPLAVSDR
jgi:hypothetical protein